MRDYIESFEKILPESQRTNVVNELIKYTKVQDNISTNQYTDYIDQITQKGVAASTFTPMDENKLSSGLYNTFVQNASIDLAILYQENDMLERAINSYINATQSTITEVQHYIEQVRNKVDQLRYDDRTSSSTVTYVENFKSSDNIQARSTLNASDYLDRDGTIMAECNMDTNAGYVTLNVVQGVDVILQDSPTITLVERVGVPTEENLFPMTAAIDRDYATFWGNIMLSTDAMDIPVTIIAEEDKPALVFRNGAILVYDITFHQKKYINKIAIQFFEEYPTIVERIFYKNTGTSQEPFTSLTTEPVTSTGNITTFIFQPVNITVIRVVLRQPNHKKHEYTVFKSDETNSQMLQSLIDLDVRKSSSGEFAGLTAAEANTVTGVETFKNNYGAFLTKYNNLKTLLKSGGFNWTDAQIKVYIQTGRRP